MNKQKKVLYRYLKKSRKEKEKINAGLKAKGMALKNRSSFQHVVGIVTLVSNP